MGLEAMITIALVVIGALASWVQGKRSGLSESLTQASDVVGMLAVQVGELRTQLEMKELEIARLNRDLAGYRLDAEQREGSTAPAKRTARPPGRPDGRDG